MRPIVISMCRLTICLVLFAPVASAAVVKVQGTIQNVPEITTFQTWGGPNDDGALLPPLDYTNNMEGIQVTVHFSGALFGNRDLDGSRHSRSGRPCRRQ